MKKRLISVLLSIAMLPTLILPVFAADATYKNGDVYIDDATVQTLVTVAEGNELKNVAEGKSVTNSKGAALLGWTDGDKNTQADGILDNYVDTGIYGIIDLGAAYDIKAISLITDATSYWTLYPTTFYGTNDLSLGLDGATQIGVLEQNHVTAVGEGSRDPGFIENDESSYRYVLVKKEFSPHKFQNIQEVCVYAEVAKDPAEVTVTGVRNTEAVTNIGQDAAYVEVDFSGNVAVNDWAGNNTVTATLKNAVGSSTIYSAGKEFNVQAVLKDEDTILIDPSGLFSNQTYTLVINGLSTYDCGLVSDNTIEFTTGAIAYAPYDGRVVENVALNKPVEMNYTGTTLTQNQITPELWTDGSTSAEFNAGSEAERFVDGYAVIDLGVPRVIDSVGAQTTAGWNGAKTGIALTNTKPQSYDELSELTASRFTHCVLDQNNHGNTLDYALVDSTEAYRYVVIWLSYPGSNNNNLTLKEVYVFSKQLETSTVEATVDFKGMQTAVTNIDKKSSELVTVTFDGDVDMSTVNAVTVYAVLKTAIEGYSGNLVDAGATYRVLPVMKTEDSFALDVSKLPGMATFQLVIDGALDADGNEINWISDEFTTSAIANVAYEEGKYIKNIAEDITLQYSEGNTQTTGWGHGNMTDGNITNGGQIGTNGAATDYTYLDLGAAYKIEGIGAYWSAAYWTNSTAAVYLTNTLDGVGSLAASDYTKFNFASGGNAKGGVFDYADINSGDITHQYVILNDLGSNTTVNMYEFYVFAKATEVVPSNITNPEAVTNVGENAAYLTVDYSGNVVVNENTTVVAKNKADIGKDTVLSADKTFNLKAVAVDEDTILVDPAGLISNAVYDVTISGVATAEGGTAASATVEMTTGEVANIAYDGGIIENVAANKSAIAYFTKDDAAKTADFGAWVDGNTVADIQLTKAEHAKGYVVIDLGLPYKIGSIGASTKACWNATGARFALTNTIPTSYEEAIALNAAQLRWADYDNTSTGRVGNVFDFVKAVDSETKYQYVVIWDASENSGWSCQLAEVFVYTKKGSEDESDIVTTVDFKGMQNAVTNVDTKDLVTVSFNADVDMATVSNSTVYAVAAEEKKDDSPEAVVIAQGARYEVGIIKTDGVNNSFGIDVSKLPSNVKYTLVVKDVMDLDDKYVDYTSDVFTTGIVANVAYDKDALIKNVAYGKDIYPGVATDKTHSLDTWVNDVADSDPFNLLGETFPENFVVIDLGADYNVQSMGVQITQTAWNAAGMGIFTFPDGTNMSEVTFASLTTPASRLSFTSDGAAVFDNMVDVVNVSGNARYIVLKDMSYANGGNLDLKVKEIYVFVKEMESDATVTVDFKEMKDAVTNVGTDELITVTFDKDIKEAYLNGTVYAVSQTERKYESFNDKGEVTEFISGVAIGDVYPLDVIYVDSKTIKLDPQNLEAFCDFKLVIDGVRDADDEYIKYTSDVFTTGLIAKVAYSEGKIIKNVALGKSMTIINPLDPEIHGGNGIVEAGEAEMIANAAEKLIDGDYVNSGHTLDIRPAYKNHDYFVLDLGKKYQIESIGVMWSSSRWGSAGTSVYLTNDISTVAPANGAELVKSKDAKGCTGVFDYADVKAKFDDADGYRYVILYNDSGRNDATSISPLEVSVFAYETENDFYFAKEVVTKTTEVEVDGEMEEETVFDKVLVKATIEKAEAGTVVVAEYNASGKLLNVKTATVDNGVATADLTYTAGNTYKAFIWNALSGENALTPTLPAITYDIQ